MTKTLLPQKLRDLISFVPHQAQQTILENLKRFSIICAGRKFGKSLLCSYIALKYGLLPKKIAWIVAPSYDLAKKEFKIISNWALNCFESGTFKINNSELSIDCPLGSKIVCKSAEFPTGLLGENVDLLIVDEASRIGKNIWESYLRPNLSATKGSAVFISSPIGKENWFYNLFLKGQQGDNKDWISFNFPSEANPHLDKEELKQAEATLPQEVFKQEYGGEFLDFSAQVFRGVNKIIGDCLKEPDEDAKYVMGLDLGKDKDFSVITIIDEDNHKVVYWDRFSEVEWTIQKARIIAVAEKYNAMVVVESVGVNAPIVEDLRNAGLFIQEFVSSTKSKQELISKLVVFIEQGWVVLPDIPVLLGELGSFGWELSPSGNVIYKAPAGQFDDSVISLALAVWLLPFKLGVGDKSGIARMVKKRWENQQRKKFKEDQNRI